MTNTPKLPADWEPESKVIRRLKESVSDLTYDIVMRELADLLPSSNGSDDEEETLEFAIADLGDQIIALLIRSLGGSIAS